MSHQKRIISRLDIKNNSLVKGIHLEGLRVLGNPRYFTNKYYYEGIDEIHLQDVVASLYNRNNLDEVISDTVKNVFVPINVGGGIRSIQDIDRILKLGADKVTLNSAAVRNPEFIKEATSIYGSSTISIAIEVLKIDKNYKILIESGRENTELALLEWLEIIQKYGAGEIIVTSINNEGTKKGFDLDLCNLVKQNSAVPVIAHGGAGSIDSIIEVFSKTDVDGILIASILHYSYYDNFSNIEEQGNSTFLKNIQEENNQQLTISVIKDKLKENGINVR